MCAVFISIIQSKHVNWDCVKNVQIRSIFWSVFSRIRAEYGDYGVEIRSRKTPYSDTFNAAWAYFHDKPLYLFCFCNWTSRKQCNTKQPSKCKKSLHITERKRFADRACGRPQDKEKSPSQKQCTSISKIGQNVVPLALSSSLFFVDVRNEWPL